MSVVLYSAVNAPRTATKIGILAAIGATALIGITRPPMFYEKRLVGTKEVAKIKDFGTAPNETLFPIWLAAGAAGTVAFALGLVTAGQ